MVFATWMLCRPGREPVARAHPRASARGVARTRGQVLSCVFFRNSLGCQRLFLLSGAGCERHRLLARGCRRSFHRQIERFADGATEPPGLERHVLPASTLLVDQRFAAHSGVGASSPAQNCPGVAGVRVDLMGGAFAGADRQRAGVGQDDRVIVHVDDPGFRRDLLGDLVGVVVGRQNASGSPARSGMVVPPGPPAAASLVLTGSSPSLAWPLPLARPYDRRIGVPSRSTPASRSSLSAWAVLSGATPAVRPSSTRVAKPSRAPSVAVARTQ